MCDLSIVMSYYNRKEQTLLTLDSFQRMYANKYKFEVIIVDDASNEENNLEKIIHNYNFPIKLIKISPKNKTWINPVIPYNMGFKYCHGEYIILQNPEIFHTYDICKYVLENLRDDLYVTFPVFAMPDFNHNNQLKKLFEKDIDNIYSFKNSQDQNNKEYQTFIESINYDYVPWKGWYNHKIWNARNFHFLSAFKKSLLQKIGGFCNSFKDGLWYDDDDFVKRIQKVAQVFTEDFPYLGIHQFHLQGSASHSSEESCNLIERNKRIYEENIRNSIVYCESEVDKIVHSYEIFSN